MKIKSKAVELQYNIEEVKPVLADFRKLNQQKETLLEGIDTSKIKNIEVRDRSLVVKTSTGLNIRIDSSMGRGNIINLLIKGFMFDVPSSLLLTRKSADQTVVKAEIDLGMKGFLVPNKTKETIKSSLDLLVEILKKVKY